MPNRDPQQEVVTKLTSLFALSSSPKDLIGSGSKMSAETDESPAITFLKERRIPGRQVHAVTFKDKSGQMVHFICYVVQNEEGLWNFRGGGGGGVDEDRRKAHLVNERPWAHLDGGGWPEDFYAGGYVIGNGLHISRVRLVTMNGVTLEDTTHDGIILFLTEQAVEIPLRADLYDHTGRLVNSHSVF